MRRTSLRWKALLGGITLVAAVATLLVGLRHPSAQQEGDIPEAFRHPSTQYSELLAGPKTPVALVERAPGAPIPVAEARANATETQAAVDVSNAFARSHQGAVSAAWSAFATEKVAEARTAQAQYEAALGGLETLGVQ